MSSPQVPQQDLAQQRDRTESYLRADPNNKDLLIRAVELNLAMGNAVGAQGHAEAALALFPSDAMVRCLNAHALAAQHKWADAAPIYAALLSTIPDPDLAASLATCQVWQGQHQAALATMAPFEHLPDLAASAVTLIVRALCHVAELDKAIALIEQHRVRLANDPTFLAAASLAYMDGGDVEQAAAFSKAALALGPRPIEALVVNATLALAQGDTAGALTQFKEVLAIAPDEGRSWVGMGDASLMAHDYASAKIQLERAVTLMPGSIGGWASLGWCHVFRDDLAAADKAFQQAMEIDRTFAETHGSIATVAAMRGDIVAAEASIERALRLDPACLSARLAQMVLGGQTSDPERFYALAMRVIRGRKNAFGVELKDMVDHQLGRA